MPETRFSPAPRLTIVLTYLLNKREHLKHIYTPPPGDSFPLAPGTLGPWEVETGGMRAAPRGRNEGT